MEEQRDIKSHACRLQASSANDRVLNYKPGQVIHGFTVNEVTPIPDFLLTAVKLTHESTGAKYLHLAREDSENVFNVQFRTTPKDSTGVAHILEHTVLCGSQKYPCRDPFFKMLNRSLSTFMNAFTASDYTMYPFCTQNSKDFQNLLSVYLDAVFFPLLREEDFRQEGWRLEHKDPTDSSSPLVFNGVVFNEMKGKFANSENAYEQQLQNKLLPDTTYAFVSGGAPLDIPDLTWEQHKKFHTTHYHPSNARFFTYGNLPLEPHLKQIHEDALIKFVRIDLHTEVSPQKHWHKPREYHITCGADTLAADPAKQTMVSISFLTADVRDTQEVFTLHLLSSLMTDRPNSPFYKALIEPKLGADYSPNFGLTRSTRDTYFSIGLQGVAKKDVDSVKKAITKTFQEVVEKGFEPERIEAVLHGVEIEMKDQVTQFGFVLSNYIGAHWNHDVDPVNVLQLGEKIDSFRRNLKERPAFLQDKVKQYFQDNQHRMVLIMSPDEEYYNKEAQLEAEKLNQKIKSLSKEDRKKNYEKGLELLRIQSAPQDASCLPALKVSDIERTIPPTEVELVSAAGDVPVQYCAQPTNGIVYFLALSSLNTLPEELKPYVPLFCSVVTEMGCGPYDYRQQAQQIDLTTGGMSASTYIATDSSSLDCYEQGVLFSSSCLDRNSHKMMNLWKEIFNSPHFDNEEHLQTLVKEIAQNNSNDIPESGHNYAQTLASKTLTPAGELQELFNGMDQVTTMKNIAEMPDVGSVLQKLSEISKYILLSDNMRCSVNAIPQQMPTAKKEVEQFLAGIRQCKTKHKAVQPHIVEKPLNPSSPSGNEGKPKGSRKMVLDPNFKPSKTKTHFSLPFPVNYAAKCVRTLPYIHPDYPSLRLLTHIMTAKFLHPEIREKGGAYGTGANIDSSGIFSFFSFRDPNSLTTLSIFDKAIDWAKSGNFNEQDIIEGKLSAFQLMDAPIAPSEKGKRLFLNAISDEMTQQLRQRLIDVNHADLVNVANKYLTVGQSIQGEAILGPENVSIANDPSWIKK